MRSHIKARFPIWSMENFPLNSNCAWWKRNISKAYSSSELLPSDSYYLGFVLALIFFFFSFLNVIKSRTHQSLYHSVLPWLLMSPSYENLLLFINQCGYYSFITSKQQVTSLYCIWVHKTNYSPSSPHPISFPYESTWEVSQASH